MCVRILDAQVDVPLSGADGHCRDGHPFDEREGVAFHQHAVGERPGIALVGIACDELPVGRRVEHCFPLDAGRESRAAPPAQTGVGHFLHDRRGSHRQRALQCLVTTMRQVLVEADGIDQADSLEGEPLLLREVRDGLDGANEPRVRAAAEEAGVEQPRHLRRRYRAVADPSGRCFNLDQWLEPAHPPRAVPRDRDVHAAPGRFSRNRLRHLPGTYRERRGVARDPHFS